MLKIKMVFILTSIAFCGFISTIPTIAMQQNKINDSKNTFNNNNELESNLLKNKEIQENYKNYIKDIKENTKEEIFNNFENNINQDAINEKIDYTAKNNPSLLLDDYKKLLPNLPIENDDNLNDIPKTLTKHLNYIKAYGQYFYILNKYDFFENDDYNTPLRKYVKVLQKRDNIISTFKEFFKEFNVEYIFNLNNLESNIKKTEKNIESIEKFIQEILYENKNEDKIIIDENEKNLPDNIKNFGVFIIRINDCIKETKRYIENIKKRYSYDETKKAFDENLKKNIIVDDDDITILKKRNNNTDYVDHITINYYKNRDKVKYDQYIEQIKEKIKKNFHNKKQNNYNNQNEYDEQEKKEEMNNNVKKYINDTIKNNPSLFPDDYDEIIPIKKMKEIANNTNKTIPEENVKNIEYDIEDIPYLIECLKFIKGYGQLFYFLVNYNINISTFDTDGYFPIICYLLQHMLNERNFFYRENMYYEYEVDLPQKNGEKKDKEKFKYKNMTTFDEFFKIFGNDEIYDYRTYCTYCENKKEEDSNFCAFTIYELEEHINIIEKKIKEIETYIFDRIIEYVENKLENAKSKVDVKNCSDHIIKVFLSYKEKFFGPILLRINNCIKEIKKYIEAVNKTFDFDKVGKINENQKVIAELVLPKEFYNKSNFMGKISPIKIVRRYCMNNNNNELPDEIHILKYNKINNNSYKHRNIYEYDPITKEYIESKIISNKIDSYPEIFSIAEDNTLIEEKISIVYEKKEKNKKEITFDDAIIEFFVTNPNIYFLEDNFHKYKDYIICAKNYYKETHNNNLPKEIRLVKYENPSTKYKPHEYIEKSLIYNYDQSTNTYKNINGCEVCEVKKVRYIPKFFVILPKKIDIADIDKNFYNIITKGNKENKKELEIYNLVDDKAIVTFESSNLCHYFNNKNNKTIEQNDYFILEEAVQFYKNKKQQNAIPKRINIIIYEPLSHDKKMYKYFRSYIWNENKLSPNLKYELIENKGENIYKIPDGTFNDNNKINFYINKQNNNIIK